MAEVELLLEDVVDILLGGEGEMDKEEEEDEEEVEPEEEAAERVNGGDVLYSSINFHTTNVSL